MKKFFLLATYFALFAAACAQAQLSSDQPPVAIVHVNIIDATGSPTQKNMTVIIQGSHIAHIGKANRVKVPKDAKVLDAQGKFLIPGLWDMHVHTSFGDWIPGGKEVSLPLFVANGITGVRDMGSELDTVLQWRSQTAAGTLLGPRMIVAGPMLDGPKSRFPSSVSIATPDEGRKAVDDLKARGVDFIKVQSFIPRDPYFAVVDEAKKQDMVLVGHVPDAIRASEASNSGQKSIEHLTGIFEGCARAQDEDKYLSGEIKKLPKTYLETYDAAKCKQLIALMARNHTWLVPTLVWERGQWLIDDIDTSRDPLRKYAPASWQQKSWPSFTKGILADLDTDPVAYRRQFVEQEFKIVGAMHKAGVRLLAGTDTAAAVDVLPGSSLHTELEYFVRAGLTPMQALQTATLNPAQFLGLQSEIGTVQEGKLASLVLLDADPLQDIRNTRKIAAVVLNGRMLTRADLDALLQQIADFASAH
jgi:imidazolonepropionase-like amidohydrolase